MSDRKDSGAAAAVAVVRSGFQLILLGFGYRVLTVDDYLRVSVTAAEVHSWKWFPDAFFLPAYFWIYSIPVRLGWPLGSGAIVATILLASISSALFYLLFRKSGLSKGLSILGALLFSVQPMPLWLGGVPLSETLGLLLLLLALLSWDSPSGPFRIAASLSLALVTLVRYECWPYAVIFAAVVLYDFRRPFKERLLRSATAVSGLLTFAIWRLSRPDPWGPLLFSQAEATHYLTPAFQFGQVLWGGIALLPLGFLALVVALFSIRSWRSTFSTPPLLVAWFLWSLVSLFLPLLSIGYYPMVFPERALLTSAALFWILGFPCLVRIFARLSFPMLIAAGVGCMVVLAPFSFHPVSKVQEETLEAARVLGSLLPNLGTSTIVVERKDLGWTVLWGLNDGDPRIVFDRPDFTAPSAFASVEGIGEFLNRHSEAACVLSSSLTGRKTTAAARPAWTVRWSAGKYDLRCVAGTKENVSSAARRTRTP